MLNKFKIHLSASFIPMPLVNNINDYDECWEHRGFNAPSLYRAAQLPKLFYRDALILDIDFGDGTGMHD